MTPGTTTDDITTGRAASDTREVDAERVSSDANDPRPIVFFDGVCGLCNHLVDFILRKDREGRILLAPLQGETAQERLPPGDRQNVDTIVMLIDDHSYRRSSAIVRILWQLGGVWSFLGSLLWLVPLPLRNLGYRLVSSCRYRFFGRKETCRLPTPEERGRLLP